MFNGLFRFIIGVAKKVLIANTLGEQVDLLMKVDPERLSPLVAWTGMLAYAFQIYYDFAGYSDMAIGLGQIMGFRLPENFNFPYISRNITEFWRRWHMTLGNFMKDYLYIPLGGNRVSVGRMYFNLWIVFLLSGLWHGASWNYVIWGAFHGLFLIIDRLFFAKFSKAVGAFPSIIITFFITLIGWTFFKIEDLAHCFGYLEAMFTGTGNAHFLAHAPNRFWTMLVLGAAFAFMGVIGPLYRLENSYLKPTNTVFGLTWKTIVMLVLLILSLGEIASSDYNPFIYFRF